MTDEPKDNEAGSEEPDDEGSPMTGDEFVEMLRHDVDDFEAALKEDAAEGDLPAALTASEWFEQFLAFITAEADEE